MASSQKSAANSSIEQQLELLFVLKVQLDLVYKQLNQYRGACRSVDRLNRAVRRTGGQLDPVRMLAEFVKFERDYRVSRKRLRKLDRQLLAVNLYDKLYDLYESLVMGESIGTGGDHIDSSAIDEAIVVDCNGPVGTVDTPVDDYANIPIDSNPEDCMEIQLDTIQPKISNNSIDSSSFLKTDVSDSSQVNSFEFQCSKCDKSFKRSDHLSRHQRVHSSEPRFKCSYKGCDYGTHSNEHFKDHQTVHPRERSFQCSQCDKSFKTSSALSKHKWTHESKSRFKCSWVGCNYGTHRNSHLKVHQKVHSDVRPFQCPQCDKSFKKSSNLSSHMWTHESKSRFKCSWEGCDFRTNNSGILKAHKNVHTGERPFQCPQCDKSYKRSSQLSNHKWTHESEPRFKCSWEGCDFGTNFNNKLKDHQTVHSDERPFQCPQCDKSFKYSSGLNSHKRTHSSQPRFKCSWEGCDFGTDLSNSLKTHGLSVHANDRPFQCSWPGCHFKTHLHSSLKYHLKSGHTDKSSHNTSDHVKTQQTIKMELYDELYDLYEGLVMEESIGTGGDLIDSYAIDEAIVVDCNGPVGTEDTSVNDFAIFPLDSNSEH